MALLKSTYHEIHGGRRSPNFQSLYRYNSAADCSISLKFRTFFGHITADTLQEFEITGSEVKVTC